MLSRDQSRKLKQVSPHSASSQCSYSPQNELRTSLRICPDWLSAAECASSTVSKYKSSWGSANSFYYLSAVGGGKAIRGIWGGVSFPKVTGARQHVLAFHQAPPATCLSCQWPHWLANSELKPLPLPTSPRVASQCEGPWSGRFLLEHIRNRCTESLIFHDILCTAHVFSFLLLLSSDSGCSCPAPVALADSIRVRASHSRRLKTNLACEYEWRCKILYFATLDPYCWNVKPLFELYNNSFRHTGTVANCVSALFRHIKSFTLLLWRRGRI